LLDEVAMQAMECPATLDCLAQRKAVADSVLGKPRAQIHTRHSVTWLGVKY